MNVAPATTQTTNKDEQLFISAVKNLQAFLNAHLRNGHEPSSSSRIQSLPALQREIEITKKLERYCKTRVDELTRQEEAQKKLRVAYRYYRLPKLPKEIIVMITSACGHESGNLLNTEIPRAISIEIIGLWPFFILKPDLVAPPFCNNFRTDLALKDISKQQVEPFVLMDMEILQLITLKVNVKNWKVVRDDVEVIRYLLQFSHRWRSLHIVMHDADHILPILKTFRPCFPFLEYASVSGDGDLIEKQLLPPIVSDNVANGSLRKARLSFSVLPALFSTGFINSITELDLTSINLDSFMSKSFDALTNALAKFPRALSSLPLLSLLRLSDVNLDSDELPNLPMVKSSSLRAIELLNNDDEDADGDDDDDGVIPLLNIFKECSITSLTIKNWNSKIEDLGEIFPKLKNLTYHCGSEPDLHVLYQPEIDESIAFPELEYISILGLSNVDDLKEACTEVLRAARIRSVVDGASSIKSVTLGCSDATRSHIDEFRTKLGRYISDIRCVPEHR